MPGKPNNRIETLLEQLYEKLKDWCTTWGLYRLAREVRIEFSDHLGLALGRCDRQLRRLYLNGILLLPANEQLLFETLCHETAHLIAHLRYGPAIAEHGVEWQEYMEKAGFTPRPVIPAREIAGLDCRN